MIHNKILSLLGLAMRGRNLKSGEFQTESSIKDGSAKLVIVAEDASNNTRKLFTDKCSYYKVPIYIYGTKESIGAAIGKDIRSCVALCDANMAQAVSKALETEGICMWNGGIEHGED